MSIEKIRQRWTDNSILVREGFPAGVKAYGHVMELLAEIDRLHSWDGLVSLLDEHYPVDIFPTEPDFERRDPGPRIISLIRNLNETRSEVERLRDQIRRIHECVFDDDVVAVLRWDDGEVIPACIEDVQGIVTETFKDTVDRLGQQEADR